MSDLLREMQKYEHGYAAPARLIMRAKAEIERLEAERAAIVMAIAQWTHDHEKAEAGLMPAGENLVSDLHERLTAETEKAE